jgi:hypothetical protein
MLKPLRPLIVFLFICSVASAQSGGYSTFRFLKINSSARIAAMSGRSVALKENDVQLALQNPAILDSNVNGQFSINYVNYFADINFGHLTYAKHYRNVGTFTLGLQSIGYGDFKMASENSDITGDFKAGEYALIVQGSRALKENLSLGASTKLIYSNLGEYNSFGTAFDAGVYYRNEYISTGLVFRDMGVQFKKYADMQERLPFSVDAGITGKLKKAPLRFTLNFSDLQRWDLTYSRDTIESNKVPVLGPDGKAQNNFITRTLGHLSGGVEILLGKNFYLAGGYNYLRRQELKVPSRAGLSGFSMGFGLKVYKFRLSYAYTAYNPASNANVLTLVMRPTDFTSRR